MSQSAESRGSLPRPRSIGLVVVHGIGEPTAGEALADFTDSLEQGQLASFESESAVKRLVAPTESSPTKTAFFPAHLRRGRTASGAQVVAAEVYWGSASQLVPGRLGVLHGIVSLMLNVPALIAGADERKAGTPGFLQKEAWLTSLLLAGPAFALNALLLATLAAYIVIHYLFDSPSTQADAWVPFLAVAGTVALGSLPWLWFPETTWSFRLVGPLSIAISVLLHRSIEFRPFAETTVFILEWLIFAVVWLLLLIVMTYIGGRLGRQLGRPSMTTLLAVCLQFGFWAVFVPLAWQMILKWIPTGPNEQWIHDLFARAVRSDGIQWLMAGIVLIALAFVVGWREIVKRTKKQPAPRLIINGIVAVAIVSVIALGAIVILYGTLGIRPSWINRLFEHVPKTHGTTALLALFPLVVKPIRLGLDLAHDVISYIYYECERGRTILSTRRTDGHPTPVRSRFHAVVDHLVNDLRVERLVIVAHSQGSVIALDELAHGWAQNNLPEGVSFVTAGSPISHLYGHYFPNMYSDWNDAKWSKFFQRVVRWANFYRFGDYVGTTVSPPTKCDFHEKALGAGAHTGYFRDPRFIEALRRWDLFAET
jgi:hypothetical protein